MNSLISFLRICTPLQGCCFTKPQSPTFQTQTQIKHFKKHNQTTSLSLHQNKFIKITNNKPLHVSSHDAFASQPDHQNHSNVFFNQLHAFYRFSRPHTIYGTIIGITSVSLLPIQNFGDLNTTFFVGLLKALVPSILMNIYVVGLNQLYDVEIDKVNKPTLPLASGDFTKRTGATIVSTCLLLSLSMGILFKSPPLLYALFISGFLGTVYSIEFPLLRWKKYPFLAASCIFIVRAIIVQIAFFIHMQKYVLGRPIIITKNLIFGTAFMCFFSSVISLFKDIPDVEGDKDNSIETLSVKLGQEKVFWLCVQLLLMAYASAITMGASTSSTVSKIVTMASHSLLAAILLIRTQSVDLSNNKSITGFYMFIWKLFYAEYFLIPFVR